MGAQKSFSWQLKQDIASHVIRVADTKAKTEVAEAAAFLVAGTIVSDEAYRLNCTNPVQRDFIRKLLQNSEVAISEHSRYILLKRPHSHAILSASNLFSYLQNKKQSDWCLELGTFFVMNGFAADPQKGAYKLSFSVLYQHKISNLRTLLATMGLKLKTGKSQNKVELYATDGDTIASFLRMAGAHQALLTFEARRAEKMLLCDVNRQVNCDEANIERMSQANLRQLTAAKLLKSSKEYKNLSPKLSAACELRIKHPDLSLNELAQLFDPPLARSGLYHRLQKICRIADSMSENSE